MRNKFILLLTKEYLIKVLIIVLSFSLYLTTLCPTIYFGDSGELSLAPYSLGIPHPLGFPLYCLLGKVITFIPLGSIPFRINLLSLFSALIASFMIYKIVYQLSNNYPSSIVSSLLFLFSTTLWEESVIARTYSLNALFTSFILYLLILFLKNETKPKWEFLSFILGVGISNHILLIIVIPSVIISFFKFLRTNLGKIPRVLFFFLLGLSIYLYIPIRSSTYPLINWGEPYKWQNFIDFISQKEFRHKFFPSNVEKINMTKVIIKSVIYQFNFNNFFIENQEKLGFDEDFSKFTKILNKFLEGITFFLIGTFLFIGIVKFLFKWPFIFLVFFLTAIFNILIKINYIGFWEFNQVLRYMIPLYIVFAIFIGYGLSVIFNFLKLKFKEERNSILVIITLGFILIQIYGNYFRCDKSYHWLAYDRIKNTLNSLEEGGIFLAVGDNDIFPAWYITRVEKLREDLTILPKSLFLSFWLINDLRRYGHIGIEKNFYEEGIYNYLSSLIELGYPVYSLFEETYEEEDKENLKKFKEKYIFYHLGLPLKITDKNLKLDKNILLEKNLERLKFFYFDDILRRDFYRDAHTSSVLLAYIFYFNKLGILFEESNDYKNAILWYEKSLKLDNKFEGAWINLAGVYLKIGKISEGIKILERLVSIYPKNWQAYYNLGIAYSIVNMKGKALKQFEKVIELNPTFTKAKEQIEILK